ncbi:vacuolar membrane protein-domain-containing protein [Aspergillus granulosus]|uniref:Vacuolar membrane protein-domain-containing protein n=1 Tax=Aspergillus granulosus TaxID=176169 RepID=A0ABR4H219_9EURO
MPRSLPRAPLRFHPPRRHRRPRPSILQPTQIRLEMTKTQENVGCLGRSRSLSKRRWTTLGIPILIFILHFLNRLAMYTPLANPPESIESGNYGDPPRAGWWLKQSVIYFMGLLGMKICVFFLIQSVPLIVEVGDWALRWTEGNAAVQIIFVMLLFPVIMNAIQYYIIDIFIKKPISASHELLEDGNSVDGNDHDDRHALLAGIDDGDDESDDDTASKSGQEALHIPSQSKEVANRFDSPELNPVIVQEYASSGSGSTATIRVPDEYDETDFSTKLNVQPK